MFISSYFKQLKTIVALPTQMYLAPLYASSHQFPYFECLNRVFPVFKVI